MEKQVFCAHAFLFGAFAAEREEQHDSLWFNAACVCPQGSIEERLKQLQDAHRDFGPGSQHFLSSKTPFQLHYLKFLPHVTSFCRAGLCVRVCMSVCFLQVGRQAKFTSLHQFQHRVVISVPSDAYHNSRYSHLSRDRVFVNTVSSSTCCASKAMQRQWRRVRKLKDLIYFAKMHRITFPSLSWSG